jgi:hypothetical protein
MLPSNRYLIRLFCESAVKYKGVGHSRVTENGQSERTCDREIVPYVRSTILAFDCWR